MRAGRIAAVSFVWLFAMAAPAFALDSRGGASGGSSGVTDTGDLGGSNSSPTVVNTHLSSPLPVSQGGTNATSSSTARTSLSAAASGANGDVTSLTGLTTPVQVNEGGTASTSPSAARSALGAAASGANGDVTSLTGLTTPLTTGQGGTGNANGTVTTGGDLSGASNAATVAKVNGNTPGGSCASHKWASSLSSSAVPTCTQPAASDVTGLATSATTDTTNASNITSGNLGSAEGGLVNVPPTYLYYGTGNEGAFSSSSGSTALGGEHHYSSLTISGSGQIKLSTAFPGGAAWTIVRVNGACSLASTATCTKEDGTTDSSCAIDASGTTLGVTTTPGIWGCGGGGGAAGATNNGSAAAQCWGNNFKTWEINGASGGVVSGASPAVGGAPTIQSAQAFLSMFPANGDMMSFAPGGGFAIGGRGASGGPGGGTGGAGGDGAGAFILVCKSFTTTTGHIVTAGMQGVAGSGGTAGGGGGGGGGMVVVAGPGGYTGANIDVNGGNGGAPVSTGQTGGKGGKGVGWNCDTTAGTCTAL
ncbi:MAG TPA: hypothetical protein VIX59_01160 [Candidatus Binataceae bacterium]